jgi:hypothetical protein
VVEVEDGDYLLAPVIQFAEAYITPLPETVHLAFPLVWGPTSLQALRLEVRNGEATEGVDIVFRSRDPGMAVNGPLPVPTATTEPSVTLPPAGMAPGPSNAMIWLIAGPALGVVGALCIVAGLRLARVRGRPR